MQIIFLELEAVIQMKISENEYSEIQILGLDSELIASITDRDIIVQNEYKVVCVPNND